MEVVHGGRAFLEGVRFVVLGRKGILSRIVPASFLTLGTALASAGVIWTCLLILRIPPIRWFVEFHSVLFLVSLVILQVMWVVVPNLTSRVFVTSLCESSPDLAKRILARDILRGWKSLIWDLLVDLSVGMGSLGFMVVLWPLIFPAFSASATVAISFVVAFPPTLIFATTFFILISLAVVGCLCKSAIYYVNMCKKIGSVSYILAGIVLTLVIFGLLSGDMVMEAIKCTIMSMSFSKQLLTQYSIRMTRDAWARTCERSRFFLIGFGFPVWALVRFVHPLVVLLLLEVLQGAAAATLTPHIERTRGESATETPNRGI